MPPSRGRDPKVEEANREKEKAFQESDSDKEENIPRRRRMHHTDSKEELQKRSVFFVLVLLT